MSTIPIGRFAARAGGAIRRRASALRRAEAGATIVEFALVAPILLLIVFAAIDFGRALWVQNVLVAGLREGARAAAVGSNPTIDSSASGPGATRASQYMTGVLGRTINGSDIKVSYCTLSSTTAPCSGAATRGLIFVRLNRSGGTIDYFPFTPGTPFISRLGLSQIFVRPAAMRYELAD